MPRVTGLGHVGLFVKDMPKMIDFYSNFLGMYVTDKSDDLRIVFLSAQPDAEHHELALARSDSQTSNAQQISFRVGSLPDLKEFYARIKENGYPIDRAVNHGIAFGCYFKDPENNTVEVYWPTGIDYPQPHADVIDLDSTEGELMSIIDNMPEKKHPSDVWWTAVAGRS